MSINSPVAQNNSVSAGMYHYIINLSILYKKTFLKEIKVGVSWSLPIVSFLISAVKSHESPQMLQLLLLGTGGADSYIQFCLFLFLYCFWYFSWPFLYANGQIFILIPRQFKRKIVKASNIVQSTSCLLNRALICVVLSWSKLLIYN